MKCAGLVAIQHQGKVLLLLRSDTPGMPFGGLYGFPGGLIRHGEYIKEGASREVQEETGILVGSRDMEDWVDTSIEYPKEGHVFVYAYRCMVEEAPKITLSPEHVGYLWVDPKNPQDIPMGPMTRDLLGRLKE